MYVDMLNPLNKGGEIVMDYFTADLHLGHKRINELAGRPFESVEEMNETIIKRWNQTVSKDDSVFVLGDIVMGNFKENIKLIELLNGNKYMVAGNHDRIFVGNTDYSKRREEFVKAYQDVGFKIISDGPPCFYNGGYMLNRQMFKVKFNVSHFPYSGDSHDEDRYVDFRPEFVPYSPWLIHGHVHERWKVDGYQINVGVDVWDFTPVSLQQIATIMRGR